MNREELEKEAEEYLKKKNYTSGYIGYFASAYCKQAYIDSAEPREKRIDELEMTVGTLRTFSNEQATCIESLEKENAELKKQLETVKEMCCGNGFCAYRSEISLSEVEKC